MTSNKVALLAGGTGCFSIRTALASATPWKWLTLSPELWEVEGLYINKLLG